MSQRKKAKPRTRSPRSKLDREQTTDALAALLAMAALLAHLAASSDPLVSKWAKRLAAKGKTHVIRESTPNRSAGGNERKK